MIPRKLNNRPEYVYPADEWRMVETRFHPQLLAEAESLFAVSNGYLGMRGSFEEGEPVFNGETYINGLYESWPIVYGEEAYGYAKKGQTLVYVPDGKIIRLFVDDEPFYLPTANLLEFERALDMRAGTLDRKVLWETPSGKHVSIRSKRFVSFEHRHLAAISYEVTVLNAAAPVAISSEMILQRDTHVSGDDPRRPRGFRGRVMLGKGCRTEGRRLHLAYQTKLSKMTLACGADHVLETSCPYEWESGCGEDEGKVVFTVEAKPGVPIRLTKYLTYHSSRRTAPEALGERVERTLDRAMAAGFERLAAGQRKYMDDFWRRSDVEVEGDPAIQQAIRFNLFHIIQAAGRAEGAGIPAKGLTGDGYEGHYFWDVEIYVLPFLVYTTPRIAKNLLKFRWSMLDKARERAAQVNQKGALFPWRTINGEEASSNYASGTAQYHINADIVHALRKYVETTGDVRFLRDYGVEILAETARFWVDLGFYSERQGGKFCIEGVTGPDEYNTVVDNNAYTNLMVRENLTYAADVIEALRERDPDRYEALEGDLGLRAGEIAEWRRAAESMYVPYDEEKGIHAQDDSFLGKQPWDFENTPLEKYPLLLHYHPLVIYRHKVVKQADVVLAMLLLGEQFSEEQKRRNFDFYDPLTTGDSSLSACIQSIVAAEVGRYEPAFEYGRQALLMDLANVGGNVRDGCHIASMGGTWMVLVHGVAGMRNEGGTLSFRPVLPGVFERVRIPLTFRGQVLHVEITREKAIYTLEEGEGLEIRHDGKKLRLEPHRPVSAELRAGAGKA